MIDKLPARLLVCAVATAIGIGGCGGGDDSPRPSDVPDGAAALVGDTEISASDVQERAAELEQAQRTKAVRDPDTAAVTSRYLARQALSTMILTAALEEEAAKRGVAVTKRELDERWASAVTSQFPTDRQLKRFLGGQSEQAAKEQIRVQMLTDEIHADVSRAAGSGARGARAVKRWKRRFERELERRTACAEGFEATWCSDAS